MNKQQKDKKMKNKQPTATFCITGALEKYKRVDVIVEIHNKTNARFVSGVSSRTDYLISSRKDKRKETKSCPGTNKNIKENTSRSLGPNAQKEEPQGR